MLKSTFQKPKSSANANKKRKNDPNTAVISLTDFMRIQDTIVPSNEEKIAYSSRKEHDEKLKNLSKARMREWPDSIELSKKKKLEERKQKFFQQEEEKRRIDEEERKYQELQNKMVVERANRMFFEGQDAVKSFNSKLLIADSLKEREYQKEMKKHKAEIEKEIEHEHVVKLHQNLIEHDNKEVEKEMESKAKRDFRMKVVNQQLKDAKIKKIKEFQDNVIEGEVIKKKARDEVEEQRQKEIEKKRQQEQMNKEFIDANQHLEKLKEQKRIKEQLEEKKIEEYAVKKAEMVEMRKRKEDEKFQEKQKLRQKLIDKQVEYLKNIQNKQDEILAKHVREAEEKRNNELAEKQRKMNEFKKQIDEFRDMTLKRKAHDKELEKFEDKEFLRQWTEKMKQMKDDEREELTDIRNRSKNLQSFHKNQMDLKRQKAEENFKGEMETAFKTKLMLQNENDEFLKYAEGWIQEYYKDGKEIIPMLLDLKQYKKNIFSS